MRNDHRPTSKAQVLTSAFLILLSSLLCACSAIPTPMKDADGKARVAWLAGGKGALAYNADGSMSYVYNNEKSFQHLLQTASSIGVAYVSYLQAAARELTAQLANKELGATQRAQLSAQLAETQAKLAAATTTNGKAIDAGLFTKEATPYQQQ